MKTAFLSWGKQLLIRVTTSCFIQRVGCLCLLILALAEFDEYWVGEKEMSYL